MVHRLPPKPYYTTLKKDTWMLVHKGETVKVKPSRKLLVWWQMLLVAGMIIGGEIAMTARYHFDKLLGKFRK